MVLDSDGEIIHNRVTLKVRSRREWGALPPKFIEPQKLPLGRVYVSFTGHEHCFDRQSCKQILQQYQREVMEQGQPDIPYNYLISGHGKIYEGRSWRTKIRRPDLKYYRLNQLAIGFIGDTTTGTPAEGEGLISFRKILYYGMQHNFLIRDPHIEDEKAITFYC